jgi:DtxR family Mn-dependent transcriptional regulator
MPISERAEEILETLWVRAEELKKGPAELGIAQADPAVEELTESGFVKLVQEKITLTSKGVKEGEKVVRRHRLAERLFADVLDIQASQVHPVSCKFEHLLHGGIEDNICILLGHPTTCPHGKPIPPGDCCRKQKQDAGKIVSALSALEAKQKGKVAYIQTKDHEKLQKLMAMGVLPGMAISLLQKYPSYVFQVGQSQFAVDKALAEIIFVRRT